MAIITGILTTIGGLVVILVAYLYLFQRVEFRKIEEDNLRPEETLSIEETYADLDKIFIALNNLKSGVLLCSATKIENEVQIIIDMVRSAQKKMEIEE